MTPLIRNFYSLSVWMASNYLDPAILHRLSKVLRWLLYIRTDEVPDLMGLISFCHALSLWDKCGELEIMILLEPKKPSKSTADYEAQIEEVLKPFTWLRNISVFGIQIAKEGQGSHLPSKDNKWDKRFDKQNARQSRAALRNYLNSSGIEALCQGNSPRFFFVRRWLNLLRYYQAFEMYIPFKHQLALNEDDQIEFNHDGIKFPRALGSLVDPDKLYLWLKPHFKQRIQARPLEAARACVTTSDSWRYAGEERSLLQAINTHRGTISAVRGRKWHWFDDFVSGKLPNDDDKFQVAWFYVKHYSDAFFRYDLERPGLYQRKHLNTREVLKGVKSSFPHEKFLRDSKQEENSSYRQSMLQKAVKILDEQWKEVEDAGNKLRVYDSGRWDYQKGKRVG